MPRTFFDQVLVTESPRPGSRWMKAVSLMAHVVIVLAILILPITAAFDLPGVYTTLPPVVIAQVAQIPPPPELPRAVAPAPVAVQTIPLEAPQGVTAEKELPPAPAPPSPFGAPGDTGTIPNFQGIAIDGGTLSIPKPPEDQKPRRVGGDIKP